jgi:hypothetical protein
MVSAAMNDGPALVSAGMARRREMRLAILVLLISSMYFFALALFAKTPLA